MGPPVLDLGHSPVEALYVAEAGRQATLADRLRTTLAIPVYRLDPFGGIGDDNLPTEKRGAFAGAVWGTHVLVFALLLLALWYWK